jgi:hypothetical protein
MSSRVDPRRNPRDLFAFNQHIGSLCLCRTYYFAALN